MRKRVRSKLIGKIAKLQAEIHGMRVALNSETSFNNQIGFENDMLRARCRSLAERLAEAIKPTDEG